MSRAHWLALSTVSGIGGATVRRLIERFGDVESVFAASPDELAEIPRVTPAIAEKLLSAPVEQIEEELLTLADESIDLLTWDDERFPSSLRSLPDAPVILFVRGSLHAGDENGVAIVGTRSPGERGVEIAARLAQELAARGLTIVSGLAAGIDTAAHRGALAADDGRTVAVLGSGIRVIHPAENQDLAEQIAQRGAILSELHPNAPPRGPQLMARDRIISGLCKAVIVVEAGAKSGSLDTAQRARKQGRRVYAVAGSEGTDDLLKNGALAIEPTTADLDALAHEVTAYLAPPPGESPRQQSLW